MSIREFLFARTTEIETRTSATHLDGCATRAEPPGECDCSQPLRLLRICAAVRMALELHQPGRTVLADDDEGKQQRPFVPCVGHEASWVEYPCILLRVMATVYADHEDFEARWTVHPIDADEKADQ